MPQYEPKAPYVRNRDSAFTIMMDMVVAMLPLYFMAFYFYGSRALMLGLVSTAAAVVSDLVCVLLEGKKPYFRDISAVVTGMLLPLMMSAATPYYVAVSASVFAIVFVKHVFGAGRVWLSRGGTFQRPGLEPVSGRGSDQRHFGSSIGEISGADGFDEYFGVGHLPVLSAVSRRHQLAGAGDIFGPDGADGAFVSADSGDGADVASI